MLLIGLLALGASGAARPAEAWGFEAHKFIMARAITLLPPDIQPFFVTYQVEVVQHAVDPDLWRTAGWLEEPPRHFLDMDAYGPFPFPGLPRDYDAAVAKFGLPMVQKNGTLPWRTEEIYRKLVEAFTLKAGYSRANIRFFSSVLAHYVADAHVPFHAALNYDGQLTGQTGIHARFETELFERAQPGLRIAPRPAAPARHPRDLIFETLLVSFPLVQPILDADKAAVQGRDAYDDRYFAVLLEKTRPILEQRVADSITDVAALITGAWIEAGRLPLAPGETRVPRPVRRAP